MKLLFITLVKKVQSTTGKKKVKQIFKTKEYFTTYLKLIINELGCCPARADNVYSAHNEQDRLQSLLARFALHMANIIELKLHNQPKLFTIFQRVLCEIQGNQIAHL